MPENKTKAVKAQTPKKESPKTKLLNRAIAEISACKTVDEAKAVLTKMRDTSSTRASIDFDSIVVRDAKGDVTHIKCSESGLWFPVSEFAKAANKIGHIPTHKAIKNAKSAFGTQIKSATKALTDDFMNDNITADAYKAQLKALEAKEFDVKEVVAGLTGGLKDKPRG